MDWISVLLLILFFVFPLIQQILEQRKRGGEAPTEDPEQIAAPRSRPGAAEPEAGGWQPEWEDWAAPDEEKVPELPGAREQRIEVLTAEQIAPELTIPEAVRVADPVVSMEALRVDHGAEHRKKFRERLAAQAAASKAAAPTPHIRLSSMMRGRGDLRRAIILSEVLGPPRAFDPAPTPHPDSGS